MTKIGGVINQLLNAESAVGKSVSNILIIVRVWQFFFCENYMNPINISFMFYQ